MLLFSLILDSGRSQQKSYFVYSLLVVLVVKVPELATPPLTSPHYPSTPSPHPLPKPGQWEVRVTVATLIFPLWVHLPAEKGSRWCNMKPWSTPPGTLVFPVPSIFSMKFLCLSLTESGEGRERDKEGGRGVATAEKNFFFFLPFHCKVSEGWKEEFWRLRGSWVGVQIQWRSLFAFWTFCSRVSNVHRGGFSTHWFASSLTRRNALYLLFWVPQMLLFL